VTSVVSRRETIRSLNNGSTSLPVLLLFPHPTNHAARSTFLYVCAVFCVVHTLQKCIVLWSGGPLGSQRVCTGWRVSCTVLEGLESDCFGLSLQDVVVQNVEGVWHVGY